jgi:hypothetical protein
MKAMCILKDSKPRKYFGFPCLVSALTLQTENTWSSLEKGHSELHFLRNHTRFSINLATNPTHSPLAHNAARVFAPYPAGACAIPPQIAMENICSTLFNLCLSRVAVCSGDELENPSSSCDKKVFPCFACECCFLHA